VNTKPLIHRFASGKALVLFDQAVVSGGNFALGVLLARLLGLEAYGAYSLLWMGVLFALSLHQAYLTQPLVSLFAGKTGGEQTGYLRQLFKLQFLISVAGLLLASLVFGLLKLAGMEQPWLRYLPLMGGLAAVFLLQDFLRKIFFVKKRYSPPLLMDLALFVPMLGALVLLHFAGQLTLFTALWAMLAMYSLSAGLSAFYLHSEFKNYQPTGTSKSFIPVHPRTIFDPEFSKTAKEHYHYSIWLLGTSLLQWFSGNFFLIAAAGVLGTVAVGALRMAQNMVGLCHVLFLAMENIVPAEAAQQFFQHGQTQMFAYLRRVTALASIPVVLMLGFLTAAAPWLIRWLYGPEYLPFSYLVGAYALLYIFVFIGYPLRFALRTLQFTSPIFIAYCLGSTVSLLTTFPMARAWGVTGIFAGLLGTQLLTLAVYVIFLLKKRALPAGMPSTVNQ
jgi:O-antigen/teichoic acid export membrane protein